VKDILRAAASAAQYDDRQMPGVTGRAASTGRTAHGKREHESETEHLGAELPRRAFVRGQARRTKRRMSARAREIDAVSTGHETDRTALQQTA
jgi:hypothetical protein